MRATQEQREHALALLTRLKEYIAKEEPVLFDLAADLNVRPPTLYRWLGSRQLPVQSIGLLEAFLRKVGPKTKKRT